MGQVAVHGGGGGSRGRWRFAVAGAVRVGVGGAGWLGRVGGWRGGVAVAGCGPLVP